MEGSDSPPDHLHARLVVACDDVARDVPEVNRFCRRMVCGERRERLRRRTVEGGHLGGCPFTFWSSSPPVFSLTPRSSTVFCKFRRTGLGVMQNRFFPSGSRMSGRRSAILDDRIDGCIHRASLLAGGGS